MQVSQKTKKRRRKTGTRSQHDKITTINRLRLGITKIILLLKNSSESKILHINLSRHMTYTFFVKKIIEKMTKNPTYQF